MEFEQVRIQINLYHKYLATYELKFFGVECQNVTLVIKQSHQTL